MDNPRILVRAVSGLIPLKNFSGLLVVAAIVNYSAQMAE